MMLRVKPGFELPVYDPILGIDCELVGTEAELREFCARALEWLDRHPGMAGYHILSLRPPARHVPESATVQPPHPDAQAELDAIAEVEEALREGLDDGCQGR